MTTKILSFETPAVHAATAGDGWQKLYRAGALAAGFIVLVGLLDIFIMFVPGTGTSPGARTVVDWFDLLHSQWFLALRDLGLLNMLTMSCSVVAFFALLGLHRRVSPLTAALAFILTCMAASIYIANNTALPMLTLSNHYAVATDPSQRTLWASAGQALLAQEDLTAGAYPGFFFSEVAGLLMALAVLRGGIFTRREVWVGIVGTACLFFFNIVAAFIPAWYDSVMPIFGAGGGLLTLVWYILIARRLWIAAAASPALSQA